MLPHIMVHFFFVILVKAENGDERKDAMFYTKQGYMIVESIFKKAQVGDTFECMSNCLAEEKCVSANFQNQGYPKHLCALSSSSGGVLKTDGFTILQRMPHPAFPKAECSSRCKNDVACVPDSLWNGYRCKCRHDNKGLYCEDWQEEISSCKDIYTKTSRRKNMVYTFTFDSKTTDAYCHMSGACASGGWTLVMKTDGNKDTFRYDSTLWTNKDEFNPEAGKTGLDKNETKLSFYWSHSFQEVCLGLRVGEDLRWLNLKYSRSSLYDVISMTSRTPTTAGRDAWLRLMANSSFQDNCNLEGFNNRRVRIGIRGNNENECASPDSYIGIGYSDAVYTGNFCGNSCNNGVKNTAAFGYIMIK
ncbi:uncharacterized protein LOC5508095 [Nematostella vectensis]|uniref:uncharacterized protein LOC5508095 n=1 Tax=Nematostella vectensis TaxID=45351 RepID=UPI00138FDB6F|nr:uncharacterized protein LOC5508095 [Nematostella vectensis]XP_032232801.1 uncharacterized protein LOC5508095 [Nematostella vectensis]